MMIKFIKELPVGMWLLLILIIVMGSINAVGQAIQHGQERKIERQEREIKILRQQITDAEKGVFDSSSTAK